MMTIPTRFVKSILLVVVISVLLVSLVSAVWWNPFTWSFFQKQDVRLSPVCETIEHSCSDDFGGDGDACRVYDGQGCSWDDEWSSCSGTYTTEECTDVPDEPNSPPEEPASDDVGNDAFVASGLVTTPDLINVDFGTSTGANLGSAVIGSAGDYWNGDSGVLKYADGTMSSISVSPHNLGGVWGYTFGINNQMMNSYRYPSGLVGTGALLFFNVPAGRYDLYLYGHGDQLGQNTQFILNGVSKYTSTNASALSSSTWQEGLQYVVYRNVSLGGNVSVNITDGSRGFVNGLQLVPASSTGGGGGGSSRTVQLGEWANRSEFIQLNVTTSLKVNLITNNSLNFTDDSVEFIKYVNGTSTNTFQVAIITAEGVGRVSDGLGTLYALEYRGVSGSAGQVRLTFASAQTCTDSDGGLNYSVKGSSLVTQNGVLLPGKNGTDYCTGVGNELMEFICQNNDGLGVSYKCPNGCANGACLPAPVPQTITTYGNYTVHTGDIISFGNAYVKTLVLQFPTCANDNCTTLVNRSVVRFFYLQSGADAYTELESGESRTFSRINSPLTSLALSDVRVTVDSIVIVTDGTQSNTLSNNNSAHLRLTFPQICQDLIEQVKNPSDFSADDLNFSLNWNSTYTNHYWINEQNEEATEYQASWNAWSSSGPEWTSTYYHVTKRVAVFTNTSFDARDVVAQYIAGTACQLKQYWVGGEEPSQVYVCNYNVLDSQFQDRYGQVSSYRQLYWAQGNVFLGISVSTYGSVTEAEQVEFDRRALQDMLRDLKNNEFKYNIQSAFDVPLSEAVTDMVYACSSTLQPTQSSFLACKIEPVLCPPHGEQTQVCIDLNTQKEISRSTNSCSPGTCSGCMVSQWFDNIGGPSKCIPYGFRAEAESGTHLEWMTKQGSETLRVDDDDQTSLAIISNEKAVLTVYGKTQNFTYTLVPGTSIDITEAIRDIDDDGVTNFILFVDDIDEVAQTVAVTITYEREQKVVDTFNAYCEIDGRMKEQKSKDYNGNWATCQNNYECASNVCSNGECIEIKDYLEQGKSLKAFFIKALCRLNPFDDMTYNECVANYLE